MLGWEEKKLNCGLLLFKTWHFFQGATERWSRNEGIFPPKHLGVLCIHGHMWLWGTLYLWVVPLVYWMTCDIKILQQLKCSNSTWVSYIAWLRGTVCQARDVHKAIMSHNQYSIGGGHMSFLQGLHLDANNFDNLARSSGGVFTYLWYAFLCHLSNIFICISGIPASMAEVVTSIRKLCAL